MSIVALKRKTAAQYAATHSTSDGFSINGRTRLQGIGANLAKSVTRTPFKGIYPKGHGGGARCRVFGVKGRAANCNVSSYPIAIQHSGSCYTPQTTVKPSVKNTSGMLQTRFMGILHGTYPNTWVQQTGAIDVSQLAFDAKVAALECVEVFKCQEKLVEETADPCTVSPNGCVSPYAKETSPKTYEQHNLNRVVVKLCNRVPDFPFHTLNNGCNTFYRRVEEVPRFRLF